jgi:hypothetical protein
MGSIPTTASETAFTNPSFGARHRVELPSVHPSDRPLVRPAPNLACVTEPTASGRRQWAIGPSQMPDVRNNAGSTNRIATKNQSRRFVDTTHSSSAMIPRVSGPYSTAR